MASPQCALQGVIALYSDLAQNPDKDFGWDKGVKNARNHGYKEEWIEKLPTAMWDYCAAVGNPFELGEFLEGASVLDLGCGAGVDLCVAALLVGEGGKAIGVDITLLDISQSALEIVKKRLGSSAEIPLYRVGDVCAFSSDKLFDVWHDRAVFHFLQKEEEQLAYIETLSRSLSPEGHAIIGTFAIDGPDSCSALPVRQYDEERMKNLVRERFDLINVIEDTHTTPSGSEHKYCFFMLRPKY